MNFNCDQAMYSNKYYGQDPVPVIQFYHATRHQQQEDHNIYEFPEGKPKQHHKYLKFEFRASFSAVNTVHKDEYDLIKYT